MRGRKEKKRREETSRKKKLEGRKHSLLGKFIGGGGRCGTGKGGREAGGMGGCKVLSW